MQTHPKAKTHTGIKSTLLRLPITSPQVWRAKSRLDEIDEEDEEEEDYSNLDEDSGEEQDSETGQGSDDHD